MNFATRLVHAIVIALALVVVAGIIGVAVGVGTGSGFPFVFGLLAVIVAAPLLGVFAKLGS